MASSCSYIPRQLLRKLPKVELHRHLDGSVRPSTILALAIEQKVELPSFDLDELKKLVTVTEECTSLEEYLRGFEITLRVLQKPYAITRVMFEVCEDAVRDGVCYMEVRFSPILHVKEGLSLSAVMEAIVEGRAMAQHRLPITVQIIVCGLRHMSSETTGRLAEIAWRYRHKGVAGFDLAGPESGFSSKHHKEAFDTVRDRLLYCTLHAGEAAGYDSIADSIQYCGAHRIGHGVKLIESPALLQYVVDRNIAIEICVTSNLQTKAISAVEEHPLRSFFDAGATVVICCDNCTVSGVTSTGEYDLCQRTFGFNVEEMLRLIDYGYCAAFLTSVERQRLRVEALYASLSILKSEGFDISGIAEHRRYWEVIGLDVDKFLTHDIPTIQNDSRFWIDHVNPPITLDVVTSMPKTDLDCRLEGSVSLELVWKELQTAGVDLQAEYFLPCSTFEEFQEFILRDHSSKEELLAKRILNRVLQTQGQLERAVASVVEEAIADNVKCKFYNHFELVLRCGNHLMRL